MKNIPESDWKKMRALKADALNFACERILKKVEELTREREGKENETYLKLWKLMKQEDREIAIMFDEMKRSTSLLKLVAWKRNGVISDERFSEFSDETQQTIKSFFEVKR